MLLSLSFGWVQVNNAALWTGHLTLIVPVAQIRKCAILLAEFEFRCVYLPTSEVIAAFWMFHISFRF